MALNSLVHHTEDSASKGKCKGVTALSSQVPKSPWCRERSKIHAGLWWLMSVILAIQEAEIRRIAVPSQPAQIAHETLS
jgi:hypothetical protein